MKKLFNKAKNDLWMEQTVCMSIIARYGTGGGNVPIVLESNQNHARAEDTEICPTLPASMGLGGGYVPMIVMQRRFSNIMVSDTEISPTIEAGGGKEETICR